MDHTACLCKPDIMLKEPARVTCSSFLAAAVQSDENKMNFLSEEPFRIACWENACSMADADQPLKVSLLDDALSHEVAECLSDPDSVTVNMAARRWKRRRVLNAVVARCKHFNVEYPDVLKRLAVETWDDAACDKMSKRTWETSIQLCRVAIVDRLNAEWLD